MMNIERNARVRATDGEIGYVRHVIVDPDTRELTHVVVAGHGHPADVEQWMVPVTAIAGQDGDVLQLTSDRASLRDAYPFNRERFEEVDDERARDESARAAVHGGAPLLDASDNAVQVGTGDTVATDRREVGSERDITADTTPRTVIGAEPYRLQLREERLKVQREAEQAGAVRIVKRVTERIETVEVPLRDETLYVEKVAGSGRVVWDGRELADGEVVEIALVRERAFVEKETYVTEDVTIRKDARVYTERLSDTVRREHLVIDDPDAFVVGNEGDSARGELYDMGGVRGRPGDAGDVNANATTDSDAPLSGHPISDVDGMTNDDGMPLSRETVSGSTAIIGEQPAAYTFGAFDMSAGKDELVGLPVITSDGDVLGTVGEVRGNHIKVSVPMASDYWLPRAAIASMAPGGDLMLHVDKDALDSVRVSEPAAE